MSLTAARQACGELRQPVVRVTRKPEEQIRGNDQVVDFS